ncbi:aromatic-ring-hydroxylating dioxygenase subunit beta [Stutzerimonas nitrititolerans]|uniref:aromatic-ring-hydroxylating dioxygenase subunit beta n=1 Tax=Stutzerimonas nitrititolerans TaxID=2482751 RepID=UPI0028A6EB4F|nr:aromatic-ring-hydroxylating dioxygenase subunit beta [Stutzerimonas nitrititolerans]
MSNQDIKWDSITRFLRTEALHLDNRAWDDGVALYEKETEYWVPAWDDDGELTQDPNKAT